MQSFKTLFAVDFTYLFKNHLSCINTYYSYQAVNLVYKMGLKVQECIKNVIYDITSWQQWTGPNAKWFDKCTQSTMQSITIYTIAYPTATKYFTGALEADLLADSNNCTPGIVWTPFKYIPDIDPIGNMFTYIATKV